MWIRHARPERDGDWLHRVLHHTDQLPVRPAQSGPGSTGVFVKTIEQGASTSALLTASLLVEGVTGRYFEDCQEAEPHQPLARRRVAAYALDSRHVARLWDLSLAMLSA
jgi:hypothetical protein